MCHFSYLFTLRKILFLSVSYTAVTCQGRWHDVFSSHWYNTRNVYSWNVKNGKFKFGYHCLISPFINMLILSYLETTRRRKTKYFLLFWSHESFLSLHIDVSCTFLLIFRSKRVKGNIIEISRELLKRKRTKVCNMRLSKCWETPKSEQIITKWLKWVCLFSCMTEW